MKKLKKLLAITLLFSILALYGNRSVSYADTNSIEYVFSGAEANMPGYAEGIVKITPSISSGYCHLYWANYSGVLDGYEKIASTRIKSSKAFEYKMAENMAIPEGATQLAVFFSNSVNHTPTALDGAILYEIPEEKRFDSGETEMSFASVSDVHANDSISPPLWTNALNYFSELGLEAVIISGDLTGSGAVSEYETYIDSIAASSYPSENIYAARGNHDSLQNENYITYTSRDDMVRPTEDSPWFYVLKEGDAGEKDNLFIFLAQELDNISTTHSEDNFSTTQLDWFEGVLKQFSGTNTNIFIVEHAFIQNWGPGDRYNGLYSQPMKMNSGYPGNLRFQKLLMEYKEAILMTGHSHLAYNEMVNYSDESGTACRMIHNSSVCVPKIYNETDTAISVATGNSEGYVVNVYSDNIVYNGTNLVTEKKVPTACYIFSSYTENRSDAVGVEITKMPDKTDYRIDEYFNAAGMELTATYADGSKKVVQGWTLKDNSMITKDTEKATILYADFEIDIPINVIDTTGSYTFTVDGKEYILLGTQKNALGETEYLIMEKTGRGVSEGELTFDKNNMFFAYKGKKFDTYLSDYTAFIPYMVNNVWGIGDNNTATSYLCLPSTSEMYNNLDGRAVVTDNAINRKNNTSMTVSRVFWHWSILYRYGSKVVNSSSAETTPMTDPDGDNVLANTQKLTMHFSFYVTDDFFKNVKLDVAATGSDVKDAMKTMGGRIDFLALYSDEELDDIGFEEEDYSNSTTEFKVGEKEYILLGSKQNQSGETEYLVMDKARRYVRTSTDRLTYTDANGFSYSGKKFDEYKTDYPEFADYMAQNTWTLNSKRTMVSYICMPSAKELYDNLDARAVVAEQAKWLVVGDMTASKDFNDWEPENGSYLLLSRYSSGINTGKVETTQMALTEGVYTNAQAFAIHFAFYVSSDFFKNVPVSAANGSNIIYGSDEVKKAIASVAGLETMTNLYGIATAKALKEHYGPSATSIEGTSFEISNKTYIMLGMRTNTEGKKEYLIMDKTRRASKAGKLSFTSADGFSFDGKHFDEYKTDYPEFADYMVNTKWELGQNQEMTSFICMPSTDELYNNPDAKALVAAQASGYLCAGSDMTAARKFNWTSNGNLYLTRFSNGINTGKVENTPMIGADGIYTNSQAFAIHFAFYITEDFFKDARCDVSKMSDTVKASVNASKITDAQLKTLYGEIGLDTIRSKPAYEIAKTVDKSGDVKVTVNFTNNTLENMSDMRLIVATYSTNKMHNVALSPNGVGANTSGTMEATVSKGDANTAKILIWDNMKNILPICKAEEIKLK